MKQIEKISYALLIGSLLFAAVILSIHGIGMYMEEPSLFIPPADSKSRTSLNMVLEAENLEGLRKVCALWASQEDRARNALDALVNKTNEIQNESLVFILSISFMFILGSAHMHFQVRKIRKESENAL